VQSQKKISRKDAKKRQDFLLNHFFTRERFLDVRDPAFGRAATDFSLSFRR
jgi:hypothetical protein